MWVIPTLVGIGFAILGWMKRPNPWYSETQKKKIYSKVSIWSGLALIVWGVCWAVSVPLLAPGAFFLLAGAYWTRQDLLYDCTRGLLPGVLLGAGIAGVLIGLGVEGM